MFIKCLLKHIRRALLRACQITGPPIQRHLKSNKTQTQHQFEVKIEQDTNTTTVELTKSNKKQTQQQSN